ncbi:EAL domain-containing protein [Streptococcus parauberis]|uniref:EAL domain-containing protein n=1 Tax=Streptococcus parauberis TaxID=1348 RepID=UPI000C15471C|nr:EAL domain-containing protein [Streptococcus parauberis]PIA86446.1 phage resistance protein [Streptococcus parauberis]
MKTEDLYLVFQPIVACKKSSTVLSEYEVLLRSTDKNTFPCKLFNEILRCEQKYNTYIQWFTRELEQKIIDHEEVKFSINIDIDQFQFQSTIEFLKYFTKYSERLIVEVTEHTPNNKPELMDYFKEILIVIKKHHFEIAIDDFTEEINSFYLYLKNRHFYDRVKISLYGFRSVINIFCLYIYVIIMKYFFDIRIDIVVERIDTSFKANFVKKMGIPFQQGYYWGKSSRYIKRR